MEHSNKNPPEARWVVLGELERPAHSVTDIHIAGWLLETLQRFELPSDLTNRILSSAHQALARISPPGDGGEIERLIHLLIYAPAERASTSQTWGFFRIEKRATEGMDEPFVRQVIEFYLYREGARSS